MVLSAVSKVLVATWNQAGFALSYVYFTGDSPNFLYLDKTREKVSVTTRPCPVSLHGILLYLQPGQKTPRVFGAPSR